MTKQNFKIQVQTDESGRYRVGILNNEYRYEWSNWYVSLGKAFNKIHWKMKNYN